MAHIDLIHKGHRSSLDEILGSRYASTDQDKWNIKSPFEELLHRLYAGKYGHGNIAHDNVGYERYRGIDEFSSIGYCGDHVTFDTEKVRHCPAALFMVV